jgi:putative membrane protein
MPHDPGPPPWAYGHHWGNGPAGGGGIFSLLTLLGWLIFLALMAWLLLRWFIPSIRPRMVAMFAPAPTATSALELLRQRYARGEIDDDTFEYMWERLEASYRQEPPNLLPASRYERRAQRTRHLRRRAALAAAERRRPRARHTRNLEWE